MIPVGPRLAILPGKGIGPIRFGATVATVERHMQNKCDVLTDRVCRYFAQAVEFELRSGKVVAARVHRPRRPAGKDSRGQARVYGVFNGGIPPDVRFGMHVPGAQLTLGRPRRVKQVSDELFGTREIHHYPGMTVEYDQVAGAPMIVLSGVRVFPE